MLGIQQAFKRAADSINLFGAQMRGFQIVESEVVNPGETLIDNGRILIYKPTEIQRIVRLGIREAHPWFKDPLDPLKFVR